MPIRSCRAALSVLILIAASVPTAASVDDALSVVQPRADRTDFEILLEGTDLDRDTRAITEMLFRTYVTDLTSLGEQIAARADSAGRREVEEALAGRRRIDPAELRQMRADVRRVELDAWEPAQRLLDDLILNTQLMVAVDDDAFDTLVRQMRRSVLLAPSESYAADASYAGEGVDLLALLDNSMAAGELGAFDPLTMASELRAYELALDELLQRDAQALWRGRLFVAIARVERDDAAVAEGEKELVATWRNIWLLNQQYASLIGQQIEARAGAPARLRWDDRVEQACFPWLYSASRPEQQYRWISENRLIEPSVKQEADGIILEHRREHRELAREAITLILRGRLDMQLPLSARTDPASLRDRQAQDILRDLLQNSGRRSHRDDKTSQTLEALLPERLRAQMRSDLAAASFGRRR